MSRVYFHSPHGTAELRGSERAHLGQLVRDVAAGVLNLDRNEQHRERLRSLIHPGHYMANHPASPSRGMSWSADYRLYLNPGESRNAPLVQYGFRPLSTLDLVLNTAVVLGGDAVRLAARIEGQCEIHGWVDGPHRGWLADVMQAGLDTGVYRRSILVESGPRGARVRVDQGWDEVIGLLRSRDDEPVVMSFSVEEYFPNRGDWRPFPGPWQGLPEDEQRDAVTQAWGELPAEQRWEHAMAALRERSRDSGLELCPDDWDGRFGHGLSLLDLVADDYRDRIERVLAPEGVSA